MAPDKSDAEAEGQRNAFLVPVLLSRCTPKSPAQVNVRCWPVHCLEHDSMRGDFRVRMGIELDTEVQK